MLKFFIKAITRIMSTNLFTKLLFGVDCSKSIIGYQTGFSTILMKKALKKYVRNGDNVLDIGTGACAIHSIWLKKNFDVNVTATEINDKYIGSAKRVAKHNNVKIRLIKSNLFKSAKGNFGWAIFNPPFSDREDKEGYKIVERLLKETPRKTRLMIVVNAFYVNQKKIENIIKKNNYKIIDITTKFFNTSKVYVVKRMSTY